jgi:hypothetical protein
LPSGKRLSLTTVRPGIQVSYSIRLRIGYFRGLCRGVRRLPTSALVESLAKGQQPRGKGRRRIRGPVCSPLFGKGLPARLGRLLGLADNVFQDTQGNQEEQEDHRAALSLAECAVDPDHVPATYCTTALIGRPTGFLYSTPEFRGPCARLLSPYSSMWVRKFFIRKRLSSIRGRSLASSQRASAAEKPLPAVR